MTSHRFEGVGPQLRSLLTLGPASALADGPLVERFLGRDPEASRLAFEALVERHGPMVLRVARGVLRDPHDAQDAFQATFLVLVRKAGSIRGRDSLATWLHGVALRVAVHAKAEAARRRRLERASVERAGPPSRPEEGDDLGPRLHEEVGRLPERYRAAVVLCYLEGHTCEDAARVLNWPIGTVKSRLARARERLRGRLGRLGLPSAFPPLSPGLASATARLAGGSSAPASASKVFALAEGALTVMTFARWKYAAIALLAAGSWLGIASVLAASRAVQAPPEAEVVARAVEEPPVPIQAQAPDPLAATIPRSLEVRAGRGTARRYALDDKGDRILIEEAREAAALKEAIRKLRDNRSLGAAARKALEEELARPAEGPWKEVDSPLTWVVVTGVVDNQGVREALAIARKIELAEAFPRYKRLEVQRQVRRPEGDWSGWGGLDLDKNYEVLDHCPGYSEERTPAELRPPALFDSLPILTKGTWGGVDHERIVRLPKPKPDPIQAGLGPLYESPLLALRYLDFTVEPGAIYRYRLRVVLVNPDADEDGEKVLYGPWSEPTKEVVTP